MAVFIIIPTAAEEAIARSLANKLPGKYYKLPRGEFLASYSGTSKALSDFLGVTDGSGGHGVVASISGYYGRAPNEIWEWVKQHWDADK